MFLPGLTGLNKYIDRYTEIYKYIDRYHFLDRYITSVSDPYHVDADPDPRIRIRDDGSGS